MTARTLTTLLGNSQRLDGGAMFGNAPRALWQRWLAPDEEHRIALGCRALLVREPDRNILIETGIGAFFSPELKQRFGVQESHHVLLDSLAGAGLSDADIDIVLLTHLHFDHAGGLLAAWQPDTPARLLFPNARYITGRRQWQRACAPHPRDRASYIPELLVLLEASGRLELVPDGDCPLGAGWHFHWSDGHTPGQLLPQIDMRGGPVVSGGGLVPGTAWVHAPITMGYNRFPKGVIDEKPPCWRHCCRNRGGWFSRMIPRPRAATSPVASGAGITLPIPRRRWNSSHTEPFSGQRLVSVAMFTQRANTDGAMTTATAAFTPRH